MTNMHPEILLMLSRERERELAAAIERRQLRATMGPRGRRLHADALSWLGRLGRRRRPTVPPCPDTAQVASQARI
jgi:hypothetical protein